MVSEKEEEVEGRQAAMTIGACGSTGAAVSTGISAIVNTTGTTGSFPWGVVCFPLSVLFAIAAMYFVCALITTSLRRLGGD